MNGIKLDSTSQAFDFEFDMVALAKWESERVAMTKASLNSGAADVAARHNARQAARRAKLALAQ
jgi:hypothetical protein